MRKVQSKRILAIILCILLVLASFSGCADRKALDYYEIAATLDEKEMVLDCVMEVIYINKTNKKLNEVCFNVFSNAYRENSRIRPIGVEKVLQAFPNGLSYGFFDLYNTSVNGKEAVSKLEGEDHNFLKVKLNKPLAPNKSVKIKLAFSVKLANIVHRLGYSDKTVNLGNFFPILAVFENNEFVECPYYSSGDPFYSEAANYEVALKVKSDYVLASSGDILSVDKKGEYTTHTMVAKNVRDFAMVLSKNFSVITAEVKGTHLKYYYYDDIAPQDNLKTAVDALKTFNEMFGDYPYKQLSVVKTGFLHGGMEYPNLVYISDKLGKEEFKETIVHEIAHQWWYGVVGNNQIKNAWLDESLTQYSTLLFYEKNKGYGVSRNDMITAMKRSCNAYFDVISQINKKVDTSLGKSVNEYKSEMDYVYITYILGDLMFDNLRVVTGDDKFFAALKQYYKDNKFKISDKESLYRAFRLSSKEVEGFIEAYLKGEVIG